MMLTISQKKAIERIKNSGYSEVVTDDHTFFQLQWIKYKVQHVFPISIRLYFATTNGISNDTFFIFFSFRKGKGFSRIYLALLYLLIKSSALRCERINTYKKNPFHSFNNKYSHTHNSLSALFIRMRNINLYCTLICTYIYTFICIMETIYIQ